PPGLPGSKPWLSLPRPFLMLPAPKPHHRWWWLVLLIALIALGLWWWLRPVKEAVVPFAPLTSGTANVGEWSPVYVKGEHEQFDDLYTLYTEAKQKEVHLDREIEASQELVHGKQSTYINSMGRTRYYQKTIPLPSGLILLITEAGISNQVALYSKTVKRSFNLQAPFGYNFVYAGDGTMLLIGDELRTLYFSLYDLAILDTPTDTLARPQNLPSVYTVLLVDGRIMFYQPGSYGWTPSPPSMVFYTPPTSLSEDQQRAKDNANDLPQSLATNWTNEGIWQNRGQLVYPTTASSSHVSGIETAVRLTSGSVLFKWSKNGDKIYGQIFNPNTGSVKVLKDNWLNHRLYDQQVFVQTIENGRYTVKTKIGTLKLGDDWPAVKQLHPTARNMEGLSGSVYDLGMDFSVFAKQEPTAWGYATGGVAITPRPELTPGTNESIVANAILHSGVEVWDTKTEQWKLVQQNKQKASGYTNLVQLAVPRLAGQSITELPNGKLLIIGGHSYIEKLPPNEEFDGDRYLRNYNASAEDVAGWHILGLTRSVEIFDPKTMTGKEIGQLKVGRAYQSAILLADNKVLIVGGDEQARFVKGESKNSLDDGLEIDPQMSPSYEIFNIKTGQSEFFEGALMDYHFRSKAFLLPNQTVYLGPVVTGTSGASGQFAEILDFVNHKSYPTSNTYLTYGGWGGDIVQLDDGRLVTAYGEGPDEKDAQNKWVKNLLEERTVEMFTPLGGPILGFLGHPSRINWLWWFILLQITQLLLGGVLVLYKRHYSAIVH
ncbi:hypothetical protein COT87_02930, partial [Candidatus Collierbacteria bacterium CG10_big_fil_rev_8_21_14_0_10_44_9]